MRRRALTTRARLESEWDLARAVVAGRLARRGRAIRRNRAAFYRSMWDAAAQEVGVTVRPGAGGVMLIDVGQAVVAVRETSCSIDGPAVREAAGDKVGVYGLLAGMGMPIPANATFTLGDLAEAERFAADRGGACVVKPARGTAAGRGVTTGLVSSADIRRASAMAAAEGARALPGGPRNPIARLRRLRRQLPHIPLLIEEQVPGHNYRLLYLDGVLIDAVRRGPPSVVGDGVSSLDALVRRLNDARLRAGGQRGQWIVTLDLDLDRTLAGQGLRRSSVVAEGVRVTLKTVVNQNDPESNHPARDEVCEDLVRLGAAAAGAVGARLAGVDVITPDPSVPLEDAGGRILEVNTTPGFAIHLNGHPGSINPATVLLRHLSGRELAST